MPRDDEAPAVGTHQGTGHRMTAQVVVPMRARKPIHSNELYAVFGNDFDGAVLARPLGIEPGPHPWLPTDTVQAYAAG